MNEKLFSSDIIGHVLKRYISLNYDDTIMYTDIQKIDNDTRYSVSLSANVNGHIIDDVGTIVIGSDCQIISSTPYEVISTLIYRQCMLDGINIQESNKKTIPRHNIIVEHHTTGCGVGYYGGFTKKVEELVLNHINGYIVHVCCVKSKLGDIRIDMSDDTEATVVTEIPPIPVDDCVADTVICDTQYSARHTNKYHAMANRGRDEKERKLFGQAAYDVWLSELLREIYRILKPGGTLIFLHWFIPKSKITTVEKVYIIDYGGHRSIRALSIIRKMY